MASTIPKTRQYGTKLEVKDVKPKEQMCILVMAKPPCALDANKSNASSVTGEVIIRAGNSIVAQVIQMSACVLPVKKRQLIRTETVTFPRNEQESRYSTGNESSVTLTDENEISFYRNYDAIFDFFKGKTRKGGIGSRPISPLFWETGNKEVEKLELFNQSDLDEALIRLRIAEPNNVFYVRIRNN
jgi:hypothetical protein